MSRNLRPNQKIPLAERRQRLIELSAAQRRALGQQIELLRQPLALVDQGLSVVRFFRRHPVWLVSGGLLFGRLKPAGTIQWLRRGWLAWQLVKKLRQPAPRPTSQIPS